MENIYKIYLDLCHFRMTPLRTIIQHVNDVSYATPAKRDPKIGFVMHCGHVISSRPLFRIILNGALQVSEPHFVYTWLYSNLVDKRLVSDDRCWWQANKFLRTF